MPNTASAKKMVRKIAKRTEINNMWRSRYKTFVRKVEDAVKVGNKAEALEAYKLAQPVMHKTAAKGVYSLNKVSRELSRLSAGIKRLPGEFVC